MSTLSIFEKLVFAFAPLVLAVAVFSAVLLIRFRVQRRTADGPAILLHAAVKRMPDDRSAWGAAMLAELGQVHGAAQRWVFALGCVRVALFPPATTAWLSYWIDPTRRVAPVCGILSVALPPLGLPLILLAAFLANAWMTHDIFFNGELVPGIIGSFILFSIACTLAGVPLGIAGLVRREKARWLCVMGVFWSLSIFCYWQIVQYLAGRNLN